ncbi:hypothetical protein [Nocardia mexicana]|uniref:Trypsin n=1 Tax=Nocardia mexicana TaxID=279262 RepID=A0A370H9I6_9NOCA|nr:hypothetical protein [Nocardia mexicana]RDI53076.1 hypothetical protein DFR68_103464 [Nocardia mexicana]
MRNPEFPDRPPIRRGRTRRGPARFAMLFATILAAACTASAPAAVAAPQVAVYPGMTLQTENEQCSVAMTGRLGATWYAVTAGHCFEPGAQVYTESGTPFGWFEHAVPDGDAANLGFALIHLHDNAVAGASTGRLAIATIDPNPAVGQPICKVGARTGTTCGVIGSVAPTHLRTTVPVDHGDSGGVVYTEIRSGSAAFVGMVVGMGADFSLVEPAAHLTELIRTRGPQGAEQFRWYVTDSR